MSMNVNVYAIDAQAARARAKELALYLTQSGSTVSLLGMLDDPTGRDRETLGQTHEAPEPLGWEKYLRPSESDRDMRLRLLIAMDRSHREGCDWVIDARPPVARMLEEGNGSSGCQALLAHWSRSQEAVEWVAGPVDARMAHALGKHVPDARWGVGGEGALEWIKASMGMGDSNLLGVRQEPRQDKSVEIKSMGAYGFGTISLRATLPAKAAARWEQSRGRLPGEAARVFALLVMERAKVLGWRPGAPREIGGGDWELTMSPLGDNQRPPNASEDGQCALVVEASQEAKRLGLRVKMSR